MIKKQVRQQKRPAQAEPPADLPKGATMPEGNQDDVRHNVTWVFLLDEPAPCVSLTAAMILEDIDAEIPY
jgi:hypothetical protein